MPESRVLQWLRSLLGGAAVNGGTGSRTKPKLGAPLSPDAQTLAILFEVSTQGVLHEIQHYLYFRRQTAGEEAVVELRRRGFATELERSDYDGRWLVLAKHEVVPTEELMESTRRTLEALARRGGGEYDGWEAAVPRDSAAATAQGHAQRHTCPVCGYPGLEEPAYDEHGSSSFEICPCCGIEFGYEDSTTPHEVLRRRWIEGGMRWWHEQPPEEWDPLQQLEKAGFSPKQ